MVKEAVYLFSPSTENVSLRICQSISGLTRYYGMKKIIYICLRKIDTFHIGQEVLVPKIFRLGNRWPAYKLKFSKHLLVNHFVPQDVALPIGLLKMKQFALFSTKRALQLYHS